MSTSVMSTPRIRRILVVEDEATVRDVIARHLRRNGFEVLALSNAEEVLLAVERDGALYDMVLTDVHLPGVSGVELTRMLLARSPLKPIVLITGDPDEALARQALATGAAGYLLKPFKLFELDGAVGQALSRLELLEATGALARAGAAALPDGGAGGGVLSTAWLALADERSGAGEGHGYRVARIADAIAKAQPDALAPAERRALDLAARAHELGRLLGPSLVPAELASRTSQFLTELGIEAEVVRTIRHLREKWDGSGGPAGIEGEKIPPASRILAVADAVDHEAVAGVRSGLEPAAAVEAAIATASATAGSAADPGVLRALEQAEPVVVAIWTLSRWPGLANLAQD